MTSKPAEEQSPKERQDLTEQAEGSLDGISASQIQQIADAYASLDPESQAVIHRIYVEGLTVEGIAVELGSDICRVKNILSSALSQLEPASTVEPVRKSAGN